MDQVVTRFKAPKNPNKKREPKAADKRPGMSPEHLAKIRKLPSCISLLEPCDPHHLRIKRERGVGLKATDQWTVPLTRHEHDELHRKAHNETQEAAWFRRRGIDCYVLAKALWDKNHSIETMRAIILAHRKWPVRPAEDVERGGT